MASFLTSALTGVNNLSNLVDKVSQIKDNIEKTLDNAVGETHDEGPPSADNLRSLFQHSFAPVEVEESNVVAEATEGEPKSASNIEELNGDTEAASEGTPIETEIASELQHSEDTEHSNKVTTDDTSDALIAAENMALEQQAPVPSETDTEKTETDGDAPPEAISPGQIKRLEETLKRREAQLEKASTQLAVQEEQLTSLREALSNASADKRVRAAEAKAEQLLKEGLALSEKQGKLEGTLRKVRKEKEELESREKKAAEELKKEQAAKAALQNELNELRDVRKRGEESIAQIAESSADAARRLEEARTQAQQATQREQEMKANMERSFAEIADLKKQAATLTQQNNALKRDLEHARYQLKEQLDSKQLHGSRSESLERSLAEAKAALDEQTREARALEADLRTQLARATEQLRVAEKRAEEAVARSLDATEPLMRQIEALNEQRAKQEQASSAMLTRAVAAEAAEAEATKVKRRVEQARSELALRVSELESQLAAAKAEASRALSDAKIAQKRADEAERERDSVQQTLDALRSTTDTKIAEQRLTEMQLRQTLALETEKTERLKRSWEERIREAEERHQVELRRVRAEIQQPQHQLIHSAPIPLPSPQTPAAHRDELGSPPPLSVASMRRFQSDGASSVHSSSIVNGTQEEILGNVLYGDDYSVGGDITEGASSRYLLQTSELQAGIRRRDAKIKVLTEQLETVSRQKDDLVSKMVELQKKIESMQAAVNREAENAKTIETLRTQATLMLELLGEKEEQIDALQADLEEVKATFRTQIEQLLSSK